MIIEKGNTRTVFIFENIVIKIARIYWKSVFHVVKREISYEIKHLSKGLRHYKYKKCQRFISHRETLSSYFKYIPIKEKKMGMKILPLKRYEIYYSIPHYLISGIMANLQEYRFYKRTHNEFVMPTLFSFFGLFNIQKRGGEITFWENEEVWGYIYHNSQNEDQPFCDGHTLSETKNYGMDDGKLKLVDYGSRQLGEFLKLNGKTLYENFKHP